jgi:hypothetical protein
VFEVFADISVDTEIEPVSEDKIDMGCGIEIWGGKYRCR